MRWWATSRGRRCRRSRRRRGERQPEEARPRNAGDAVGAVGEALPVDQDEADDLAEGQRDDGEIVAAQAQHRKAEHHAPAGGEHAGERQADPERPAEMLGQQRVGVGADRVERDVAEVEQAGEADDDVQAPAEHHIGQDQRAEVEQIAAARRPDRRRRRRRRAAKPMAKARPLAPCRARSAAPADDASCAGLSHALADERIRAAQAPTKTTADDDRPAARSARSGLSAPSGPVIGADADQQREQAEGDAAPASAARLQRARRISERARSGRVGAAACHVRPSRLPAGRECRRAGRSA